ncbi:uncharacterized protein TrAtP1_003701 [Trichoderma atroviride]|uniref:Uncharacterized protein n=1 Tax=Hypocrea atroviridis (strain ATCC 20476 / IMI 206040) TaxID=452589 RepID=G9NWQ0_HYPAI|nr:uncharacterized protein TRIATDRAFT_318903 [Trichoderma atroviride IMI 206040]EHK45401.1 hypothetical protein TRIATDRAFT_318903 [Trichoderma atroviride IMI 206040]UKZ62452.1 hypothetical protein TrAtP1_003701 [Trichoderma atroviride]
MGAGARIDASGPFGLIRASALLCIASSRLAAALATDRPSRRGQPSISRWLLEPERVKRRCMAGAAILGLRSRAGRRGPVAQWQQPSKRRGVSRPLIGRAKCRCAPQPGQSAARSRLAAGVQSLYPGPLSCAAGIRGAPPKLQSSSILYCTSYLSWQHDFQVAIQSTAVSVRITAASSNQTPAAISRHARITNHQARTSLSLLPLSRLHLFAGLYQMIAETDGFQLASGFSYLSPFPEFCFLLASP